jgi:hypothetical protein
MATFRVPVAAPRAIRTTPSAVTECTRPGVTTVTQSSTAATALTRPAPTRSHSAPVTRMVARAPRDTHSSAAPSASWLAPTWVLMSGMRTAQLATTKPPRANIEVIAVRMPAGGPRSCEESFICRVLVEEGGLRGAVVRQAGKGKVARGGAWGQAGHSRGTAQRRPVGSGMEGQVDIDLHQHAPAVFRGRCCAGRP